jgi:hypothetical protein
LLNHSLERSLRLVTPVSGLFIVVFLRGAVFGTQPTARRQLSPRSGMHLLSYRGWSRLVLAI